MVIGFSQSILIPSLILAVCLWVSDYFRKRKESWPGHGVFILTTIEAMPQPNPPSQPKVCSDTGHKMPSHCELPQS